MACYEACCHAIWMRNFISALGVVDSISRPLKLFCDNSATVAFSQHTRSISRAKHIDVKFYFVKEKVIESLIDIEHMSTKSMLANPLTKGLPICVSGTCISNGVVGSLGCFWLVRAIFGYCNIMLLLEGLLLLYISL